MKKTKNKKYLSIGDRADGRDDEGLACNKGILEKPEGGMTGENV